MATVQQSENKELVTEYLRAIEEQDFERVRAFFTDDFTVDLLEPGETEPEEASVDVLVDRFREFFTAFPDATYDVQEMAAEDDWVLCRFEVEGTHDGEFLGIEPTGSEVSYQVYGSYRIEDGEIAETHGASTFVKLLAQLGVELPIE